MINMRPRILGFLLTILGFGGMLFAGYVFVTGSGGRGNILEVTSYLILGAVCFFAGVSYIYDADAEYIPEELAAEEEFEDIIPIQQQWRAFHIATSQTSSGASSMITRSANGSPNLKVANKAMVSSDSAAAS